MADVGVVVEAAHGRGRGRGPTLVVGLGALLLVLASFHAMGEGPLAAPPLAPDRWQDWVDGREPLVAVVAGLRLLVLALGWYLVGASALGVAARLLRIARLIRIADALTIPTLRRALRAAMGVSLATAIITSAAPGSPAVAREPVAREPVARVHAEPRPDEDVDAPRGVPGGWPIPMAELARRSGSAEFEASVHDETTAVRTYSSEMATEVEHVVVLGESFWTIAEAALETALGRTPSEQETGRYWTTVIEANRHRLVDADNPDLIFPGHVLVVPPAQEAVAG